jgi:hypothetical protein
MKPPGNVRARTAALPAPGEDTLSLWRASLLEAID